jgi:hypothetical protein
MVENPRHRIAISVNTEAVLFVAWVNNSIVLDLFGTFKAADTVLFSQAKTMKST